MKQLIPINTPPLFTSIQRQMDPLEFGLSRHRKFQLKSKSPFLTPNHKLYKQSTQAFYYKKSGREREKSEDLLPEEQFDQKMFQKKQEGVPAQYTPLNKDIIKTKTTLIHPEFSPSIFQQRSPMFQQPRLISQSNPMYQTIISEKNTIKKNSVLVDQINKLKNLGLLKDYRRNFKQFQGRFKIDFIMNDFHSKATNPGYARNGFGSFYTS